jgi:hypothetical protein
MLKDISILIDNLTIVIEEFKHKRKEVKELKDGLAAYNISSGDVQKWINQPQEELPNIDSRALCLFADEVFKLRADLSVKVDDYFSERQIKEAKTTFDGQTDEKITLPHTFENVIQINDDFYVTKIKASDIKRLVDGNLIQYNPETQRELRIKKDRKNPGSIIEEPKVNPKSVQEIKQLLKSNEIVSTTLTFNARLGSTDADEELIYDSRSNTLTVTEGTLLDCLDGFHRVTAIAQALTEDPTIDAVFVLNVVNYGKSMAQTYFSQLNNTNPIAKSRLQEMNQNKFSNFIVKQLQVNSELRGKVSSSDMIAPLSGFLVSYNVLSNAIDDEFNIKDKPAAIECANYLTEFFNTLMFQYSDEFMRNIIEVRKESLININQMFAGYIVLAKRFKDENIPLSNIKNVLSEINFDRSNPLWTKLKIIEGGHVKPNAKNRIKSYFSNLELKAGALS